MRKLVKLARESKDYTVFESGVLRFLSWYGIPKNWTKKDLREFYSKNVTG